MEIRIPETIRKFKNLPRVESVAPDSTMIQELHFCPTAYFFRHVLGYDSKDRPIYFLFGSCIHKFAEELDNLWLKGNRDYDYCFAMALQAAFREWGNTKDPEDGTDYAHLTRGRLTTNCKLLWEDWKKEREAGSIVVIATEQLFCVQTPDEEFRAGKIDRKIKFGTKVIPWDYKTTKYRWEYYKNMIFPSHQFAGYVYGLARLAGWDSSPENKVDPPDKLAIKVIINEPPTKKDPRPPSTQLEFIPYNEEQLIEYELREINTNRELKIYRETDVWPQRTRNCWKCKYKRICSKLTNEKSIEYELKTQYVFSPWDYTKSTDAGGSE